MKCPTCGRITRVVRTAPLAPGVVEHTRLCTIPSSHAHDGVYFRTVEAHDPVAAPRAGPSGGHAARHEVARRRDRIAHLLRTRPDLGSAEIGRIVGLTGARVRQIRAELQSNR